MQEVVLMTVALQGVGNCRWGSAFYQRIIAASSLNHPRVGIHFCLDCRNLAPAGAMCEKREEDWTENQGMWGPVLALSLLTVQPLVGIAIIKIP